MSKPEKKVVEVPLIEISSYGMRQAEIFKAILPAFKDVETMALASAIAASIDNALTSDKFNLGITVKTTGNFADRIRETDLKFEKGEITFKTGTPKRKDNGEQ